MTIKSNKKKMTPKNNKEKTNHQDERIFIRKEMMTIEMHSHKQDDNYQDAYTKKITTMMKCMSPCKTTKKNKKHKNKSI